MTVHRNLVNLMYAGKQKREHGRAEFRSGYRACSTQALRTLNLSNMINGWHCDNPIIPEFLRQSHRIVEVSPRLCADICHIKGVPYAYQCRHNRWKQHLALHTSQRPTE
jgi:hypothetical protein